mgnify:CR=1 FL=1
MDNKRLPFQTPSDYRKKMIKQKKAGFIMIVIGLFCIFLEKLIERIDFKLMMKYGIDNGLHDKFPWLFYAEAIWPFVIASCFIVALIIFFFSKDTIRRKVKNFIHSFADSEDKNSKNSMHY